MLKAVLIDDEEIALDVLEIVLLEVGNVSVERKFLQVDEAFAYLEDSEVDLIFLDIEMPGMNGLIAAERLSLRYPRSQIIFVTAYNEYAVEAFEVNAFGYLLKPVSKERLAKTLERYQLRYSDSDNDHGTDAMYSPAAAAVAHNEGAAESFLHLNVLGSMELYDSDHALVTWRTKKTKEMFAYLWHHDGNPMQRHRILEDLWPDHTIDRGQALFHTTLYHLRNTLKNAGFQDAVMFGDERYWMRIDKIVSDAAQLKALMHLEEGVSLVGELVKLYRGDYLETENYAWAAAKQYDVRASYLQTLEQLLSQVGRLDRESILRKLIALEPYIEAHYKLLLQDLKDAGEGAAARKLYELMVDRFKNELGVEISIE
ncbi:response regulator [Paenibacillus sp. LMG 31456]|uniref:Response regulator n=1 Tax=Paenibacillus foliorum TaxID=2654974 RepID=A0A972GVS3_9BACL|nr:response regulator [Paenibacillus foliorum]NOU97198.1 response regulator [Paenibacillus foliorum]